MFGTSCTQSHLLLVTLLFLLEGALSKTSRPHVILVVADDLGWDDVSFHGSDQIPTPNLDKFASAGIILNNYYTQHICSPTRSALMTGRYPIHLGLQHGVLYGPSPYGLGLDETILPQYLKRLDYATHIVGKWHLGFFAKEYTPTYRGFDSHFGYWLGSEDYWDHTANEVKPGTWGLDFRRNMEVVRDKFGQYSTELFTQESEQIIRNHNKNQPLFLYLAHQAVHRGNHPDPMQVPYKYYARFPHIKNEGRRKFAGMVSALDESFGNVTRALYETGMLDNSIIIFTTDNGGPAAGYDDNHASNAPLRGLKNTLWEGGVRGAGFVYSSFLKRKGTVSHQLMHVSDWLPTIISAVNGDVTKLPENLDGTDMWGTLNSGLASPRIEILHNIDPVNHNAAIRLGDFKLITGNQFYNNDWYKPEQYGKTRQKRSISEQSFSEDFIKQFERFYHDEDDILGLDDILKYLDKVTLHLQYSYYNQSSTDSNSARVKCGPIPPDARTNCIPGETPCLYNIKLDPCEYYNLASKAPEVLNILMYRMRLYSKTAVPIRNLPVDPRGYPIYHNMTWVPWITLDSP